MQDALGGARRTWGGLMPTFSPLLYKAGAAVLLVLALIAGYGLWHHRVFAEGAASVQTQWDAQKAKDAVATQKAQFEKQAAEDTQRGTFNSLAAAYEAATHAPQPSIADRVSAGLAAGSLQLRGGDAPVVCPASPGVPEATARSRAADAAATQALADRVANSIAAVRAGEAADKRERDLDAQIVGLQGVLNVERK